MSDRSSPSSPRILCIWSPANYLAYMPPAAHVPPPAEVVATADDLLEQAFAYTAHDIAIRSQ